MTGHQNSAVETPQDSRPLLANRKQAKPKEEASAPIPPSESFANASNQESLVGIQSLWLSSVYSIPNLKWMHSANYSDLNNASMESNLEKVFVD